MLVDDILKLVGIIVGVLRLILEIYKWHYRKRE
jgi:hypothetical protein